MKVTVNYLATLTRKTPRTCKRRTENVVKDAKHRMDSADALEAIYLGDITKLDGEFVSTPEAVRRLTIAKKAEIDLDMEIKSGLRIPIDTVKEIAGRAFMSIAATIKANRDKVLTEPKINEMLTAMRDCEEELTSKNGGSHK